MNTVPNPGHRGDAYALALERERIAWEALHRLKRTDQRYAEALAEWRAAADSIGIAAEQLIKKPPSAWSQWVRAPEQAGPLKAEARQ
jgi:hypothetical protein